MTQLAKTLIGVLGRPVIDKSGFTGTFDVKLDLAPSFHDGGITLMSRSGYSMFFLRPDGSV